MMRYATNAGSSLGTEIEVQSNLNTGCLLPAIIAVADSDAGGLSSHTFAVPMDVDSIPVASAAEVNSTRPRPPIAKEEESNDDAGLKNTPGGELPPSPRQEPHEASPTMPLPQDAPRNLNVSDALGYLDAVKKQFEDQTDVYNQFLDIMKEFKSQHIETFGVIERVAHLFYGHHLLISGFNTFLPGGYHIECPSNDVIHVTTPNGHSVINPRPTFEPPPPPRAPTPETDTPIKPAYNYIQKIKKRCDPDTYKRFLDILARYTPDDLDEVSAQINALFKNDPDLTNDFLLFMPEMNDRVGRERMMETMLPQKRKRKDKERDRERERREKEHKEREREKERETRRAKKKERHAQEHAQPQVSRQERRPPLPLPPPPRSDDTQFFERVKRSSDSQDAYNEFLKLVNLFTQGIIDTGRLVRESRRFILDGELYKQFKEILGWDDRRERDFQVWERDQPYGFTRPVIAGFHDRPTKVDMGQQYGSYRKLAPTESKVTCSGRDDMCRSVLNDEWVAHPTWTSEDPVMGYQRKNVYEEAMHRCEEERHEYDFHIDAITRTISILEPINNKIAQLTAEERATFKVKPNIGGMAKAINHRVIKKIWGREGGVEVIQAMQDMPSHAIPVVLQRLKSKEEEWKRAQREWNKVWREVEARNYARSLDQQAITFKITDKKALTTKTLVSQIEAAREEQMARKANLVDPLFSRTRPRWQLEFELDDIDALQDVCKLVLSYLDRLKTQLSRDEHRRIEGFVRTFIPLFFMQDPQEFGLSILAANEPLNSDVDMSDGDSEFSSSSGAGSSKGKGKKGADLRKKLLKNEQAKSARQTRSNEMPSPSMDIDSGLSSSPPPDAPQQQVFYANTLYYVLLRLIETMYSRLAFFRNRSIEKTAALEASHTVSPTGYYDVMLESCELLFDNQLEPALFEERIRSLFGVQDAYRIYTMDKVVAAIVKQIQAVLGDAKSIELFEMLKQPGSTQDPRVSAQKLLGPEENLFRVDWSLMDGKMRMQLVGKEGAVANVEAITARWQEYIRAFTSTEATTQGLEAKQRRPFLRKNMPKEITTPKARTADGLEIRLCVRTYRFFYVPHSEDYFAKIRDKNAVLRDGTRVKAAKERRLEWFKATYGGTKGAGEKASS